MLCAWCEAARRWCVDLDEDGADEVVVGHREPGSGEVKGPGVYDLLNLPRWAAHRSERETAFLDTANGIIDLVRSTSGRDVEVIYRPGREFDVARTWLDIGRITAAEQRVVLESLTAIRRAGADIIFTYGAIDAARLLRGA